MTSRLVLRWILLLHFIRIEREAIHTSEEDLRPEDIISVFPSLQRRVEGVLSVHHNQCRHFLFPVLERVPVRQWLPREGVAVDLDEEKGRVKCDLVHQK